MACIGVGRLLGHRYRGRYSTEEFRPWWTRADPHGFWTIPGPCGEKDRAEVHEISRTYHHDVCERCGDVVNREEA